MSRQPRAASSRAASPCAAPIHVAASRAVRFPAARFRLTTATALALIAIAALAACRPAPPDPKRPPEPQAANAELRDAMQAPIEKARSVEDELDKAAEARQAAIEAAGG